MKTKINQKPIEIDAHLKYRCPNDGCDQIHWLNLLQVKTKNFKVVCDCGCVFKPKQVEIFKVKYITKNKQRKKENLKIENNKTQTIDSNLVNKVSAVLVGYGFTQKEAEDIVMKAHIMNPVDDCGKLIKQCLKLIGENHE